MAQASRSAGDSPAYLAERVDQVHANEPAGLVPKPCNLAELRAKLEEVLDPRAAARVPAPEGA